MGKRTFTDPRPELKNAKEGRYLVDDSGKVSWVKDAAIMGKLNERDDGTPVKREFDAPKTQVMGLIIKGVLSGKLNWGLVLTGALIAITLELCAISSLAFAVGLYVPIQFSTPIFLGGVIRYSVDYLLARREHAAVVGDDPEARARAEIEAIRKSETSPGVLLAAGYIAGGSLAGMLIAFLAFSDDIPKDLTAWQYRTYTVQHAGSLKDLSQEVAQQEVGESLSRSALFSRLFAQKKEDLAKEIEKLSEEQTVFYAPVPRGTKLKLPGKPVYEVPEDTTLGQLAKQELGRADRAPQILNLNKDQLKPAEQLPAGAILSLPRSPWPAYGCFVALILLLAAVGMNLVLRVPAD
jgi:hypothetical protein